MFKAIIFDFDGVILDSEPIHFEACCSVLQRLGITLNYKDYVNTYLGMSDKEFFPKLLNDLNHPSSDRLLANLLGEKEDAYTDIIRRKPILPIISGVDHYIRKVAQCVDRLGICSGSTKKEISAVLAKLDGGALSAYFNTIITSEDVQEGKPSPEGYLLTAKKLAVLPNECLVIEDTPPGAMAAKNAGMFVTALLTTYNNAQFQDIADRTVYGFDELFNDYAILT